MLQYLRSLFAPKDSPALRELTERVTALEHSEQERERVTAEQIDQLARYWKRLRTREARDASEDGSNFDRETAQHVLSLKLRNGRL